MGREVLAAKGAAVVDAAFAGYMADFLAVTRRATARFEARDWQAQQADALERLSLYSAAMDRVVAELHAALGAHLTDRSLWASIKAAFAPSLESRNFELARTFFNSVTRRVFATIGVNPDLEFTSLDLAIQDWEPAPGILRRYEQPADVRSALAAVLEDFRFRSGYRNLAADLEIAARRVEERARESLGDQPLVAVEMLRSVFYRSKAAYVMGRAIFGNEPIPLILALLHAPEGVFLDAVLMRESEVSILFSFTRSYFHVDTDCPRDLIVFLKHIIPLKPVSELYAALGFNKHGKTELYRSLQRHLQRSSDLFDFASGDRGMVMIVFTLPSFDRVFKVIRDSFAPPKSTTPRQVMERYRLVFWRDRVGRLVEAQRFRHLEIPLDRFAAGLTEELLREASRMVRREGEFLVFEHLYTERKVTPLNVYLREATEAQARRAVVDYGAAIKELAAANIFPGDFLVKNFGVTRHERVVFYDYDELCLLTDCRFRRLPLPRTPEDELAPEPWFAAADNDVFPEEFRKFLGLPDGMLELFERHHGALFTPGFWRELQSLHAAGAVVNFYPYPEGERLRGEDPA
jgi:isocitrate dehydrogenase kinase/phosphatase